MYINVHTHTRTHLRSLCYNVSRLIWSSAITLIPTLTKLHFHNFVVDSCQGSFKIRSFRAHLPSIPQGSLRLKQVYHLANSRIHTHTYSRRHTHIQTHAHQTPQLYRLAASHRMPYPCRPFPLKIPWTRGSFAACQVPVMTRDSVLCDTSWYPPCMTRDDRSLVWHVMTSVLLPTLYSWYASCWVPLYLVPLYSVPLYWVRLTTCLATCLFVQKSVL